MADRGQRAPPRIEGQERVVERRSLLPAGQMDPCSPRKYLRFVDFHALQLEGCCITAPRGTQRPGGGDGTGGNPRVEACEREGGGHQRGGERSEERSVGRACVRTGRDRGSPTTEKKKKERAAGDISQIK